MLDRIVSHDTFGVVKVCYDGVSNAQLTVCLSQFPVGSAEENLAFTPQLFLSLLLDVTATNLLLCGHHLELFKATLPNVQFFAFGVDLFFQLLHLFFQPIKECIAAAGS